MHTMQHDTRRFGRRQRGQGMTEYIIIVALVAIAAIAAFTFFGSTMRTQLGGVAEELSGTDATATIGKAQTTAGEVTKEGEAKKGMAKYDNDASR